MTTSTNLNTFKIAKGTKAQILAAYDNGTITSTDFAIATDENYVTTDDLATVATSGSYLDLSNKPTIPTVNNATLTIQKNGTTVNTFTANASTNVTANITVPTQASDIGAQDTLISGTNIKTINNESILGSGNISISSGSDVEAFTATEVQTIWDSVLPSSFSFIKGSGITDYTINNQTYTSNESIDLWDGEYTLTVSTSSVETGGLCINDTTLGLTLSCSVIVSGSSITFSNSIYTVSGTSSTNFTLTFSSGGSID